MQKGKLYLIPSPLADGPPHSIPYYTLDKFLSLQNFVVEGKRSMVRYFVSTCKLLKKNELIQKIDSFRIDELRWQTTDIDLAKYLEPALAGQDIGFLSDAGCPAVADPGAAIVRIAYGLGLKVVPLPGPNALILALMASGLNGQNFAFRGYLDRAKITRIKEIKQYEKVSSSENQTQLFIETPYRNQPLFEDFIQNCKPSTRLCLATNLTAEDESVITLTIDQWKNKKPDFHDKPCVFLLLA